MSDREDRRRHGPRGLALVLISLVLACCTRLGFDPQIDERVDTGTVTVPDALGGPHDSGEATPPDSTSDSSSDSPSDSSSISDSTSDSTSDSDSNSDIDGDKLPNAMDPRPTVADKVHYFGLPGTASSDFLTAGQGNWQSSGSELCNLNNKSDETVAVLKTGLVSVADYTVETRITVNSLGPTGGGSWADAGLVLRVVKTGANADLYQCLVDLEGRRLVIGALFGGGWKEMNSSANNSIPATGPYRIRATMKGSQLTCRLVPGPTITATDKKLSSGTVGFAAYFASVCFAYLAVVDAF